MFLSEVLIVDVDAYSCCHLALLVPNRILPLWCAPEVVRGWKYEYPVPVPPNILNTPTAISPDDKYVYLESA